MSYILCLGFTVSVYKKLPLARLFLNNYFIDEFYIDQSFKNLKLPNFDLDPNYISQNPAINYSRFFELDKNIFENNKKNNLTIEVFNNDNNFTNGFLTKSTQVLLSFAFCIKKEQLLNYKKIIEEKNKLKKSEKELEKILNYYTKPKYFLFDLIQDAKFFPFYKDCFFWINKEGKKLNPDLGEFFGGDGKFLVFFNQNVLSYNHNMYKTINTERLKDLGDKYQQYANQ